ncbi:hypothetical protein [Oceaniglobus trochenteri]|uniref:hypothetical protein n=1 Tax=Oceaniglobus trochenteri TaxID=2763260 RepID=UPI001CFFB2A6|nr:hypothetical protein [Oceaniglobus trochenteri]
MKLKTILTAGAAVLFSAIAAQAQDLAGKTVTIMVDVPAGSGGDLHGRIFAKNLGAHIPGNPDVIVVNKPGGGGATAMNTVFEQGAKDGTMLCYCGLDAAGVIAGAPGIRYVPEEMAHIGSAADSLAFVARTDRVGKAEDLRGDEAILIGGRGKAVSMDIFGNLGLKVLEANYRYIGGFGGFSKIAAAMLADEVHAGHAGLSGFVRFFGDNDTAKPVYYHPFFDTDGAPLPPREGIFPDGVPSIVDVYTELNGEEPSGDWWDTYVWYRSNIMSAGIAVTAPPGMEPAIVEMLQQAFQDTVNDPAYLEEYRAAIGEPPFFNSTALTEKIFTSFRNAPEAVNAKLEELLAE